MSPTRFATRRAQVRHWLAKIRNTQVKIEINGEDQTALIEESNWIRPATISLGSFSMKVRNAGGRVSDKYAKGQVVKFFADNINGTRLQFRGRIDYIKDTLQKEGHFLEIEGRHRAFILNETKVNFKATDKEVSEILSDIIDQYTTGFTKTNINVTSPEIKINVEWSYISFWDAVIFLCKKANFDCFVDNDLDFHFFEQGSIDNNDWTIVEGLNYLKTNEIGTDDYYEKTRVIGIGRMADGITPIIYTAISEGEGEVREVKVEDSTLTTVESVKALAEGELLDLQNRPKQASILSHGLETVEPGERIWISIRRQKISAQFRVIQITHKFGKNGWRTESMIEKDIKGVADLISERIRTESLISGADNINKLDFSFNFDFDNDDLTLTHSSTKVSDGLLELTTGNTEGRWESKKTTADNNITQVELRFIGKDLTNSKFYFSLDEGNTWQQFSRDRVLTTPNHSGNTIRARIDLLQNTQNPWPTVESMALLFT